MGIPFRTKGWYAARHLSSRERQNWDTFEGVELCRELSLFNDIEGSHTLQQHIITYDVRLPVRIGGMCIEVSVIEVLMAASAADASCLVELPR